MVTSPCDLYTDTGTPELPIPLLDQLAVHKSTSPPDNFSVTTLKAFLSLDNLASTHPTLHTANTIRSLYHSAEQRSQLGDLSAREFSVLISLFGSLSLSTPTQPYCSIYAHPFTQAISERYPRGLCRSYWSMVARLVHAKVSLYPNLGPSDCYYAMRGQLAGLLKTVHSIKTQGALYYSCFQIDCLMLLSAPPPHGSPFLSKARYYYKRLRRFTPHPHASLPYIQALLQFPRHTGEAMAEIRSLIAEQSYSDPMLLECLWQLVLQPIGWSTEAARSRLLQALSSRVRQTLTVVANSTLPDSPDDPANTMPLTIEDLVYMLTKAISCDVNINGHIHRRYQYLIRWSLEAVISEFSLDANAPGSVDSAWSQLQYISAARSLSLDALEDLVQGNSEGGWSWKAVCVLARLKTILDARDPDEHYTVRQRVMEANGVQSLLRRLWFKWTASYESEPPIFRPLSPVIAGSFLKFAERTKDVGFVELIWPYLRRNGSLSTRDVVVDYCLAAIVCGLDVEHVLFVALAQVLPVSRSSMLKDVIVRLVDVNLTMARQVWAFGERSRIVIESDALHALALKYVADGFLEEASVFLSDPRLNLSIKLDILDTILQRSLSVDRTFPLSRLFASISKVVYTMVRSHQLPPTASESLEEHILLGLAVHRSPWLSVTLWTIHRCWPRFFSHRFLLAAADEFIRQRRFRLALRLLGRGNTLDDDTHRRVCLSLVHGGAGRRAVLFLQHSTRTDNRLHSLRSLARLSRFQHVKAIRLRALRLPKLVSKTIHPAETAIAMKLLTIAGRVRSSNLLFEARERWPVNANHTAVGNTLIHASMMDGPRRRQARQMRKTLETMNRLVNEQGFVPDRVTVNILIKAMLRWTKAVNAKAVRALFDRMVRSGYPVADALPPGFTPFGTDTSSGAQFQVPEMSSPISYSAHVRPLYKMFIKALYVRRDGDGARRIVGILKGLEAKHRLSLGQRVLLGYRRRRKYLSRTEIR